LGAGLAATAGAAAKGDSAITVAATAAFCASDVPHILQKFIPAGLTVPQALQVAPPGADAGF
jgi:hypothetical protein